MGNTTAERIHDKRLYIDEVAKYKNYGEEGILASILDLRSASVFSLCHILFVLLRRFLNKGKKIC